MNETVIIPSSVNVLCLCRLCGSETISQDELINIFDTNGVALNIKSKILNCLGVEVSEHDFLPKVLCAECVDNLEKFNKFKIKCNKTAQYLFDLVTNQPSVVDNKPLKQLHSFEECTLNSAYSFYTEVPHIKIESIDEASTSNPTFTVQNPQPQLPDIHIPSRNIKENISHFKNVFPTNAQSSNYVNTAHKSTNKIVKVMSNVKKSKNRSNKNFKIFTEYKCEHCPKMKNTKLQMLAHIKYHLETLTNYDCRMCGLKLKTKNSLKTHMKLHNKEYNHVCNYCGKGFIGLSHFENHVRVVHTKDYPFQCTKCEKKFPNKYNLKAHDQIAHNDVYNYTCDICNKSFKIKSYLTAHKRKHTIPIEKRRKFKCDLCNSFFICKATYRNHMYGHTGELNFECEHCDKRYKDKIGLRVHLLTHTGVKDHVCDFCGKAFALHSNLVNHCRIHTGERPFQCDMCEKGFNQRSALVRHKKSCSKLKKQ